MVVQLGLLAVLTVAAAGSGWFAGGYLQDLQPVLKDDTPAGVKPQEKGEAEDGASPEEAVAPVLVPIDPITINLAEPSEVWLRTELQLLMADATDPVMPLVIHQDLVAYLRTLKLRQIESPSGFQHVKADLLERANIRANGKVKDVLVSTFLFE